MSYTTQYGKSRFDVRKKSKKKLFMPIFLGVFAFLILLQLVFPVQLAQFRRTVFPFLEPNVQRSFAEMSKSIRSGTSFEEAATVFCREILREGSD